MRRALCTLALLGGVAGAGDAPHLAVVDPPAAQVSTQEAIRAGVDFLVAHQNADGSFGRAAARNPYQLWCDVPGGHMAFRAATTALCWMGLQGAPVQTDKSRAAQARCLKWMVGNVAVKRAYAQQFYNVWALGYGLRALATALRTEAPGASPDEIRAVMDGMIKTLGVLQSPDGGWGYLDFNVPARKPSWSTSFTTATVLIGMHEARLAGVTVPAPVLKKALDLMERYRTPQGNYLYSISWKYRPNGRINKAQGSSLRNQTCNLALHLFRPEKFGVKEMRRGLDQLVDHHRFAMAGVRRPVPHESWYAVSGYFYLYGQQYAACVLEHMPEADRRIYGPQVVRFVKKTRQHDGSFWDYPTYGYHKFYGTGYALMALSRFPD